jgi:hypothetical protein
MAWPQWRTTLWARTSTQRPTRCFVVPGGANGVLMRIFEEIGARSENSLDQTAVRPKPWMKETLAAKKKVMGCGH